MFLGSQEVWGLSASDPTTEVTQLGFIKTWHASQQQQVLILLCVSSATSVFSAWRITRQPSESNFVLPPRVLDFNIWEYMSLNLMWPHWCEFMVVTSKHRYSVNPPDQPIQRSAWWWKAHCVSDPSWVDSWLFYEIKWGDRGDMSRGRTIKGSLWSFSS